MNESLFERCPHDKQNPYVMISRDMLQDKMISPKAKGVLCYLLSLPSDWKIFHSQLQKGLNVGEDYINSAMDELITQGYAERTRERVKGIYQAYKYKIREFKKLVPNRENQPGLTGPENPAIQSKHSPTETKETTTNQQQQPVAVSLENKAQPKEEVQEAKPKIYPCLDVIEIPHNDKTEITRDYSEDQVNNAIAFAMNPETKIKTTLQQTIKWACKNNPVVPKDPIQLIDENKKLAFQLIRNTTVPSHLRIDFLHQSVEIVFLTCSKEPINLQFSDKMFIHTLQETLERLGCKIK
jgi:hypothetical protein